MKMTKKLIFVFLILLPIFSLKAQSYIESLKHSKSMNFVERMQFMEGKDIFKFEGKTLSGKMLNSEDIEGKIAVIYFWFIACPPFIEELEELNKLVEKYAEENVEFIALTFESEKDLNEYFIPHYEFKFDIIPSCGPLIIEELNHPFGFPTAFVVNKQGKISKLFVGGSADRQEAKENMQSAFIPAIEKCLKAGQ